MNRAIHKPLCLCLDRDAGYADWSHSFYSGDLGRNGGDLLCGGIL